MEQQTLAAAADQNAAYQGTRGNKTVRKGSLTRGLERMAADFTEADPSGTIFREVRGFAGKEFDRAENVDKIVR